MYLESAVLERHAGLVLLGIEANLDLRCLRRIGVELPLRGEVPGEQDPVGPIDLAHVSPVALAAVATLAADGQTNRDIAQALYVTPKTVEVHLTNAYRKLNIASRRELPAALTPA